MNKILTVKLESELGAFVNVMQEEHLKCPPEYIVFNEEGWKYSHMECTLSTMNRGVYQYMYPVYVRTNIALSEYRDKMYAATMWKSE